MNRTVFCFYLGHLSTDLRAVSTNRYSDFHTIIPAESYINSFTSSIVASN
jgi:hypothetical protein